MHATFLIMLSVIGACLGSFLCCQARRLHLRLAHPKVAKSLGSRSICLSCHKKIEWYDNLPIVSWLLLKGKCRYCHHRIGYAEIISELSLGLGFLCLGATFIPTSASVLEWVAFIVLLFFTTIIGFLAIYDGLYGELPTLFLYLAIVVAFIILMINKNLITPSAPFSITDVLNPLFSVAILGGIYLLLYLVSKGKWVGDGDWLLATAIALVLSHPWLTLNTLFIANLTACIIMLPIVGKKRSRQIHLGPFLVIGFVIVYSASNFFSSLIGV